MTNKRSRRKLNRSSQPGGGLSYLSPNQAQGVYGQTFYGKNPSTPVGQTAIFSPGQPLQTQDGVNPKGYPIQYRFPVAYNTFPVDRTSGNADIPSFQQLRTLAKLYNGITLCERAWSDMVPRMKLKIGIKPEYVTAGANIKDYQADITYFMNWFESPDKSHDLHSWLRIALREQSQIDELYIYKRKTRGGGLHSLEIVAGDQMKPLLDDWGKIPRPPYPAYQQYPWNIPGALFRADELIHYQETPAADSPYGQSRIERIIMLVNQGLRKQKKDLSHFTEGNIPQGIMKVPKDAIWTPDQIDAFEQAWNALLAGNAQQQVRIRFTQPGMEYQPFEQYTLDPAFDKFILNIAVSSYGMSMQDLAFTEDIHKSSSDSQQNVTYRRTIDPLAVIYAGMLTNVMNTDFPPELNGDMFYVSFGGYDEEEDISTLATTYSKLTAAGILGISNAAALMKLPDDPNSPYIGRVVMNAGGPVFLDDISTEKVRAAQVQAQLTQYKSAGMQDMGGSGSNDAGQQSEMMDPQTSRMYTSEFNRHIPFEDIKAENEKDLKNNDKKFPVAALPSKEEPNKGKPAAGMSKETAPAKTSSSSTTAPSQAQAQTHIHIHTHEDGSNTTTDAEDPEEESEQEIDATGSEEGTDESDESAGFDEDEGDEEGDEEEYEEDPLDAYVYPDMPEEEIDQLIEEPEDAEHEALIQELLEQDKDEPFSELERVLSYETYDYDAVDYEIYMAENSENEQELSEEELERHYPGGHAHNQKLHGDWAHPGYGAIHDKQPKGRKINAAQVKIKAAEKQLAGAVTTSQKNAAQKQLAEAKADLKVSAMPKSNTHSASAGWLANEGRGWGKPGAKGTHSHAAAHGTKVDTSLVGKIAKEEAKTAHLKQVGIVQNAKAQQKLGKINARTAAIEDKGEVANAKALQKIQRIQQREAAKVARIKNHIAAMKLKALRARMRFLKMQAHAQKVAAAAKAKAAKMTQHAQHNAQISASRAARASTRASKSAARAQFTQAKANAKAAKVLQGLTGTLSSKVSLYTALAGRRISKTWTEQDGILAHQIATDLKELLGAVNAHDNVQQSSALLSELKAAMSDLASHRSGRSGAHSTVFNKLLARIEQELALNRMTEGEELYEYDTEEEDEIEDEREHEESEQRYTINELLELIRNETSRSVVANTDEKAQKEEESQQDINQQQQDAKQRTAADDYRSWRQRALEDKKLDRAYRDFTTALIPEYIRTFIVEELKKCTTPEEVKFVFARARDEETAPAGEKV